MEIEIDTDMSYTKNKTPSPSIEMDVDTEEVISDFKNLNIKKKTYCAEEYELLRPSNIFPDIKDYIKETINIETEYYFTIPYYFSGKPAYCSYWNYKNNVSDIFKNLSINPASFKNHYDLVGISFNCPNKIRLKRDEYGNNIDNEYVFRLNSKISIVLQKTTDKSSMSYQIITHHKDQKNIYENCVNPDKAWILHLILNEKNMNVLDRKTLNVEYENKIITFPRVILYYALYLHYSKNI